MQHALHYKETNVTTWIRFRDADGHIGFGMLDERSGLVVQHDGRVGRDS